MSALEQNPNAVGRKRPGPAKKSKRGFFNDTSSLLFNTLGRLSSSKSSISLPWQSAMFNSIKVMEDIAQSYENNSKITQVIAASLQTCATEVKKLDETSYFLKTLDNSKRDILDIDQITSSFHRNVCKKIVQPIVEEKLQQPEEFVDKAIDYVNMWASYFRVGFQTLESGVEDLLLNCSVTAANSEGKVKSIKVGSVIKIPYASMSLCGYLHVKKRKHTTFTKVWVVVMWNYLVYFPSNEDRTVKGVMHLSRTSIQKVGNDTFALSNLTKELLFKVEPVESIHDWIVTIESCTNQVTQDIELVYVNPRTDNLFTIYPSSVEQFLQQGEHEKAWRDLSTGNVNMIQWVSNHSRITKLISYVHMQHPLDSPIPLPSSSKSSKSSSSSSSSSRKKKSRSKTQSTKSRDVLSVMIQSRKTEISYAKRAIEALSSNQRILRTFMCDNKLLDQFFSILSQQTLSPIQVKLFCDVLEKLFACDSSVMLTYILDTPQLVKSLLKHIHHEFILKRLVGLWNIRQTATLVQVLNIFGNEALTLFLTKQYNLENEEFSHLLVFLHVLVRRHSQLTFSQQQMMQDNFKYMQLPGIHLDRLEGINSSNSLDTMQDDAAFTRQGATVVDTGLSLNLSFPQKQNDEALLDNELAPEQQMKPKTPRPKKILIGTRITVQPVRKKGIMSSTSAPNEKHKDIARISMAKFSTLVNSPEIAEKIVSNALSDRLDTVSRTKTTELICSLIRFVFPFIESNVPLIVTELLNSAERIKDLLLEASTVFGLFRLSLIRALRWLLELRHPEIWKVMLEKKAIAWIFELLKRFPNNTLMLFEVDNIFKQLCQKSNNHVVDSLLSDFQLLENLLSFHELTKADVKYFAAEPFFVDICLNFASHPSFRKVNDARWESFIEQAKKGDNRINHARLCQTGSVQLTDHWDDFFYLFSAF